MKKLASITDYAPRDVNPSHRLKYLDFLQREGSEEEYLESVETLMTSLENSELPIDTENIPQLIKIIQHCLNASAKLFMQDQQESALNVLEAARNLISQNKVKDPVFEKFKTALYNNIGAYCISIEDDSLAIKFFQKCLKKDAGLDASLTCIFCNNLAGIYLTHLNYEKAFKYTKRSIFLLEADIFAEIRDKTPRILKQDSSFKKNLTILLIGYLNMGSTLEGYQFRTTIPEPAKEMLELNPKDFYKNSYGLAKKFLGENHQLTQRLYFCYTKNEFILFKEIAAEISDAEVYQSPQKRLRDMLESIDNEDTVVPGKSKAKFQGSFSQSYGSKSFPKNYQIKTNSVNKPVHHHKKNMDSSMTSNDMSYDTPVEERKTSPHFYPNDFNRHHSNAFPQSEMSYRRSVYKRPQSGFSRPEVYAPPSPYAGGSPDQTQIFIQLMFQQQKELEEKFNRKFDELRQVSNNGDVKAVDAKEESKIRALEHEIEALKQKMVQMKAMREMEIKNREQDQKKEEEKVKEKEKQAPAPVNNNSHKLPDSSAAPPTHLFGTAVASQQKILHNASVPASESTLKAKESDKSTKSSLYEEKKAPAKPEKPGYQNTTNSDLPNFDASPISKNEKFHEPEPQKQNKNVKDKKVNWVPGKYAYPHNRKFKLDLNKIENHQGYEEEVRNREAVEEKANTSINIPAGQAKQTDKGATPIGNGVASNGVNAAAQNFKMPEKGPLKRMQGEKTLGANSVTSVGSINAVTKEEEPPKKVEDKEKGNTSTIHKDDQSEMMEKKPLMMNDDDSKTILEEEKMGRSDTTDRSKSFNTGVKRNSISIPTTLDYMDSPTGSQYGSGGVSKLPKHAIIRKRVFLENDSQYLLVCTATWTKEDKTFKLQLLAGDEKGSAEFSRVESELELPYKDLRKILKHVEYKDVMPVTFHIKQIKNFYTLVRYLLLPFSTVIPSEEGKKEIAIYPKPPNLLTTSVNDMPTIDFMGRQCVIIFTHVQKNTFRIILTDPEIVEDALRVDVEFDKTSFDLCFQRYGGVDPPQRSVQAAIKIIQGDDVDADDEEVREYKETVSKMANPLRCDEEELESFKVINKDLVDDLGNILKEMETFLSSIGIKKLSQLADEKEVKYSKLKVTSKMKKTTLHFLWDRPDKQIIEVRLKNFFETFAPGRKIKACGEFKYLYDSVWKHFGLNYSQLEYLDKLAICNLVAEVFNIDVFEKEMNKEDYDRYEENPISFVPIEVGAYHRVFLGEKYKFPLTLSLIGIKGEPKGVRATIYNYEETFEVGAFFHINPSVWAVNENEKKKKKSERVATLTLIENYHLDRILKKCGWEILKNWLAYDKKPNRVDILGIKIFKEIKHMEQIENVLNSDTILKYFNDKATKDEVES